MAAKKSRVKKVMALISFPLWGSGSGTYIRELALELAHNKNIEVAIVSPEGKRELSGIKSYPLDLPFTVAFTGHPDWPTCRLYKDLSPQEISRVFRYFLRSVIEAVEDFKPDLIHVQHVSILLWIASLIKSLYGINFIVTAHGTGLLAATENKIFVGPTKSALGQAKKIVAVSGDTKGWLLSIFGKELSHKTRIIPGGIFLENFPEEKKIRTINKKYNLKDKKVVLFAGKLTPQKGVYYLVKAAKDIKGDVYIIGDGPEKKNLEDFAYKMKLKNVHFMGYMGDEKKKEFEEFYYRADVFVAPSVWDEPLGLVIIEAMACKTPVIATRKGGIPLAVKNGINGLLIRPRSSRQIAEACNKLLLNSALRQRLGENARKTVKEKFTWDTIAKKYVRIYQQSVANGNHKNKKKKNSNKKAKPKKRIIPNPFTVFRSKRKKKK